MLEISRIRDSKDSIKEAMKKRGWNEEKLNLIDQAIDADDNRKKLKTDNDSLLAQRNKLSKEIGELYKSGKVDEANQAKAKVESLKQQIQKIDQQLTETRSLLKDIMFQIPNVPNTLVPAGLTEEDNKVIKDWAGPMPDIPENAIPHWELGKKYNILDFELGVKITGAGFPVFIGKGSRLQRALINFFLDEAIAEGYEEYVAPLLVNTASATGTGNLPDKEGQMYHMEKDDLYLIPTAELPLTNVFREVTLSEDQFPIRLTGYTPCFRREAGSYGADVKGLNRVHQFDKIEIVQVQHPDKSYDTLDQMVAYVEGLLKKLELPYRILRLCGGDLTFASALTYDFEVYSAAQGRWLEVSSVSNFETFQSNRLKLKYKDASGKTKLAHTLNGSALALARIIAALLENNQTENGIVIPEVLKRYTGFEIID